MTYQMDSISMSSVNVVLPEFEEVQRKVVGMGIGTEKARVLYKDYVETGRELEIARNSLLDLQDNMVVLNVDGLQPIFEFTNATEASQVRVTLQDNRVMTIPFSAVMTTFAEMPEVQMAVEHTLTERQMLARLGSVFNSNHNLYSYIQHTRMMKEAVVKLIGLWPDQQYHYFQDKRGVFSFLAHSLEARTVIQVTTLGEGQSVTQRYREHPVIGGQSVLSHALQAAHTFH